MKISEINIEEIDNSINNNKNNNIEINNTSINNTSINNNSINNNSINNNSLTNNSINNNTINDTSIEENKQIEEKIVYKKFFKPIHIIFVLLGILVLVLVIVALVFIFKKDDNLEEEDLIDFDETDYNYIITTMNDDFEIPSNKKIQVVGANFHHKNQTFIVGKKDRTFVIDNEGFIKGVTKEDFPLYIFFNESITNGSCLFQNVQCFKTADLSKMDTKNLINISNMFENSNLQEIYFGTGKIDNNNRNLDEDSDSNNYTDYNDEDIYYNNQEEEEDFEEEKEKRKEYFEANKIKDASSIFMNCKKLKKIQLSPLFNVGKNATQMFKGCSKLEDIDTTLISSTEILEMESMFEDCESIKNISFSNDFLTGEIKSLTNVFKNTKLTTLDISYFRLFNLKTTSNIFEGASIKGTLKIGKYYSNDNIRDNLFKEIAKVTDSNSNVFTPNGTTINQIFENIYYNEKKVRITVTQMNIDYNIKYREDENYKIYSNFLHFGLGWDFDESNTYDLDSSVVTFDKNIRYLDRVNYQQLNAYGGVINLNQDDLTGEGDGDDEEIRILLDSLPSEVQTFTVQLNSFRNNSLKNVKSAYMRLSTDSEVIGTYSINDAGNNIGLLIGSFSKNNDSWYFKPLNRVIPGYVVTKSISSIQEILHFIKEYKLISASDLVKRLKRVARSNSTYSEQLKFNSLYWNGTHWSTNSSNLIKSIINGRDVYNPKIKSYQRKFPVVEDVNANDLISKCDEKSEDFNELDNFPRLLHLKDNQGNGHVGVYLGQSLNVSKGEVNVVESTTSWEAYAVIFSWVDNDGTRRFYKEGPLADYNWTSHGSLDQWVY